MPPLLEEPEPGDVLLEPMLPLEEPMLLLEPMSLDGLAAELGLVAELSEPLTGPEGEVAPVPLSVALLPLGLVALLDPMLPLLLLPAVVPLPPAAPACAKAAGAKAATDNARPAPNT